MGKNVINGNEENKNDELTKYFNLSLTPSSVDVLQWWKIREIEFPILSKVVRNYYCIPATNTSVERIFSTNGRIYDDQRANLSPDMVSKLVCLNNWIKFIKTLLIKLVFSFIFVLIDFYHIFSLPNLT